MIAAVGIVVFVVSQAPVAADDTWRAPPRVSEPIAIPDNVPERAPDAPAVSSISPPAPVEEPAAAPIVTGRTLIRATDRHVSFTTFGNTLIGRFRQGMRHVIGTVRRMMP